MNVRQGDVALFRTDGAPVPGTPAPIVIARGDNSEHQHIVPGARDGDRVTIPDADLAVEPQAWRHTAIPVPAGTYNIVVQREYTPAGARQVED